MGSPSEIRQLTPAAAANLDAFNRTVVHDGELDTVAAFDDAVVALGSPQTSKDTRVRRIEVVRFEPSVAVAVVQPPRVAPGIAQRTDFSCHRRTCRRLIGT